MLNDYTKIRKKDGKPEKKLLFKSLIKNLKYLRVSMLNLDIGPLFAVYLSCFLRVHGRDSQMPGSSIGKAALVANIAHGLSGGAADEEAEFDSPETVEGIASALRKAGLDVIILEAGPDLPEKLKEEKIGFVFNIAEGRGGRDREAQVPALLSLLGIPFSGSDALVMSLTLDKALTKRFAASFGIRILFPTRML